MKKELFNRILGFEKTYIISNYGRVFSVKKSGQKPLKLLKSQKTGYFYVNLCLNGIIYKTYIHRLVSKYFLENPNNYNIVIHKDGDKQNNNDFNLKFVSNQGKINNSIINRKEYKTSKYNGVSFIKSNGKWKAQISLNSKSIYLGSHKSEKEAALTVDDFLDKNGLSDRIRNRDLV